MEEEVGEGGVSAQDDGGFGGRGEGEQLVPELLQLHPGQWLPPLQQI